ncbi:LacI family DNA-binding transcriptional regulator [Jeotgalibacillus terrae]|uniref:LacI family DNA-binding transcriptional regulator n=1 Tax=Jeotgalibacillus terrae TaxID=587735 RepID=A0ABW5ZEG9_9BACL|nr:LacI family DNA-binding transcriptional regulator [Jeotgalibacillus terrae]MBM7577852.1 LacI family transcriptional regulator [Jeotgalibacillus terrae]
MTRKKVTIREIAKESGVSIATVSRYLNKVSYTSPETERKIQKVLDQFSYTPNAVARGLAKQKSNTIAFITPDITNPFFPEMIKSIEYIAKRNGYSLLLISTNEEELKNKDFWNNLKSRYIDGFLLAQSDLSEEIKGYLDKVQMPFIRIDRGVQSDSNNSVSVKNYEGASLAVRHLIELNCKKIAHISGPKSVFPARGRLKGYLDTMKLYDRTPLVYEGDFTLKSGTDITERLLSEHKDVDGIFYANDLMAIGALKTFKKHHVQIPENIAIIGFDGIQLTEMVNPEISTIKQPVKKIGEIAVDQLITKIEQPDLAGHVNVELDVELIVRESSDRQNQRDS